MSNATPSFYEGVIGPAQEAEHFIQETGGLPEITAAAEGLLAAIAQTRREIDEAVFSPSRFPAEVTPHDLNVMDVYWRNVSPGMQRALDTEGEAGMKRYSLEVGLKRAEAQVFRAIAALVELRTDLVVSQQEFGSGAAEITLKEPGQ